MSSRARVLSICLLLSACDDEAEPADASIADDGGGKADAGSALDARVEVDARVEALDAAATGCRLDQTYSFGYQGGLVAWTDRFELAQGYLRKSRESTARFDAGNGSCSVLLADCPGLADAFRDADVLAAYSDSEEVLGNDPRIVDGSVLVIEREDGKKITIGNGCNDAPSCTPIPAGVQALKGALTELIRARDAAPEDAGAGLCP
ncbi:MAG: hypothetical protein ABW352_15965 [Polyangiales bacterium]